MSRPALFIDATLDDARAAANAQQKLLLVDFTATWCAPCRHMDQTTWRAPEVEKWIAEHAIAVQVDIDKDPSAKSLRVQAVPTIILFRGADELDRISGARPAPALLTWLEAAVRGETELDRLRTLPRTDLNGRFQFAQQLVERGLDEEATEELAWLWEHALEIEPAWIGVKHSFLIGAIQPLVERSAVARVRFESLRAHAEEKLPNPDAFQDWVTLSALLKDEERVFQFVAKLDVGTAQSLRLHQQSRVLELLEERNEWAILGRLIADPLQLLRQQHEIAQEFSEVRPEMIPEEAFAQARAMFAEQLRKLAGTLCHAMSAANRHDDCRAVANEARKLDGSSEMEKVTSKWSAGPVADE